MQVFGLPGHAIRNGKAVERWRSAMAKGLSAEDAAKAVGHPRATLYRWRKQPFPGSRRPHRLRLRSWSSDLVR
ncbi:MAG: hypothetical protein F9K43_11755, partial [Bauldia sp.]